MLVQNFIKNEVNIGDLIMGKKIFQPLHYPVIAIKLIPCVIIIGIENVLIIA